MSRIAITVWLLGLIVCLVAFPACDPSDDDDDDSSPTDDDDDDDDSSPFDDDSDDDTSDDDTSSTDDDASDDDIDDDDTDDDDTDDDDTIDDDTTPGLICYTDADGDGYGDPATGQAYEEQCPPELVDIGGDCNDANAFIYPGAPELAADGVDQDCNGEDLLPNDESGVFVAQTGNDDNPGTMAQPKLTIAAGVAAAENENKAVFVAQGVYQETVTTSVALYGGYEPVGWTRKIESFQTLLFNQEATCLTAVGDNLAIEGFSFYPPAQFDSSVILTVEKAALFHANRLMGGLEASGGQIVILDSILASGPYREAITVDQADLLLINSLIIGPAGLTVDHSAGHVVNNTFVALIGKGASSVCLHASNADLHLLNNFFLDDSPWPVAAISLHQTNDITLMNNLFFGDDYTIVGPLTDIEIVNECAWEGCREAGANLFALPQLSSDLHYLTADSPGIDAGINPSPWYDGPEIFYDCDGDTRPAGSGWDIGMDEYYSFL